MKTFYDVNQSWTPPDGFEFEGAEGEGAYLRLEYRQRICYPDTDNVKSNTIIDIFLNDCGREVGRQVESREYPPPLVEPEKQPVARRFRIWNGFLIMLQGIQEMTKCLRSY